jgi:hypothetical protein
MLSPIPYKKLSKQLRTLRTVDAAAEPVTLADYQASIRMGGLKIPQSIFDVKIRSARRLCEKYLGVAFVSQMFTAVMELPPGMVSAIGSVLARFEGYIPQSIELLYAPLRQVSQVSVIDDTGTVNVCPPSIYWVGQQRISLLDTQVWPDTAGRAFETFNVNYTSGCTIPFTAAGATLTTLQPHGLVNGTAQRTWTNADGSLPTGFVPHVDYYVVGATAYTFGLAATPGGSAIATSGAAVGNSFVGALPENYFRAILMTAAEDFYPEKKKSTRYDVSEAGGLSDDVKRLLNFDRWINL